MEPQWYWRSGNQVRGPLSTSELEELVREGTIEDADTLRLAESPDWISAREVRAMFLGSQAEPSAASTSASAARVLSDRHRAQMQNQNARAPVRHAQTRGAGTVVGEFIQGVLWMCGNVLSSIGSWFASFLPVRSAGSSAAPRRSVGYFDGISTVLEVVVAATLGRYKKTILAVIILGAIAIATGMFLNETVYADAQNQYAFEQISSVNRELDRKRGEVPAEARQKFLATIDSWEATLESRTRRDPHARTQYWMEGGFRRAATRAHLLQACRLMRDMLQESRWNADSRRKLLGQLGFADELLRTSQSARYVWLAKITPLKVGVPIAAVAVVAGFVIWRRRAGQ